MLELAADLFGRQASTQHVLNQGLPGVVCTLGDNRLDGHDGAVVRVVRDTGHRTTHFNLSTDRCRGSFEPSRYLPDTQALCEAAWIVACSSVQSSGYDMGSILYSFGQVLHSEFAAKPVGRGHPRRDDRQMLNGIFWILCSGAKCRGLPELFGPWKTVYQRFREWRDDGTLERILPRLHLKPRKDAYMDFDTWMYDPTST